MGINTILSKGFNPDKYGISANVGVIGAHNFRFAQFFLPCFDIDPSFSAVNIS